MSELIFKNKVKFILIILFLILGFFAIISAFRSNKYIVKDIELKEYFCEDDIIYINKKNNNKWLYVVNKYNDGDSDKIEKLDVNIYYTIVYKEYYIQPRFIAIEKIILNNEIIYDEIEHCGIITKIQNIVFVTIPFTIVIVLLVLSIVRKRRIDCSSKLMIEYQLRLLNICFVLLVTSIITCIQLVIAYLISKYFMWQAAFVSIVIMLVTIIQIIVYRKNYRADYLKEKDKTNGVKIIINRGSSRFIFWLFLMILSYLGILTNINILILNFDVLLSKCFIIVFIVTSITGVIGIVKNKIITLYGQNNKLVINGYFRKYNIKSDDLLWLFFVENDKHKIVLVNGLHNIICSFKCDLCLFTDRDLLQLLKRYNIQSSKICLKCDGFRKSDESKFIVANSYRLDKDYINAYNIYKKMSTIKSNIILEFYIMICAVYINRLDESIKIYDKLKNNNKNNNNLLNGYSGHFASYYYALALNDVGYKNSAIEIVDELKKIYIDNRCLPDDKLSDNGIPSKEMMFNIIGKIKPKELDLFKKSISNIK